MGTTSMKYVLYQTTCLITGKVYCGVHATNDPNDKYLGSGKFLLQAIRKYGRENFIKQVVYIFDKEEIAYALEKQIVDKKFISRKDVYNCHIGGYGGGWNLTPEQDKKRRASIATTFSTPEYKNKVEAIYSKAQKKRFKNKPGTMTGKTQTKEARAKIAASAKITSKGERNSSFGRIFMHHPKINKARKVKKEEIDLLISKGWLKGKKPKNKGQLGESG